LYQDGNVWKYCPDIADVVGGTKNSLLNIASDLRDSCDLNAYISSVAGTCLDLSESVNVKLQSIISDGIASKSAVIMNVAQSIREAFSTSGIMGVIKYIKSYFDALSNVEATSDHLEFTDNTAFIPQIFLAGIIQGAITVIGAIASTVAAIASPVLSIAISLVTSLTSKLVEIFSTAHQESYAKVYDGSGNTNPFAPYGTDRRNIYTAALPVELLDWWEQVGFITFKAPVPGGYLLVGKYNDVYTSIEFHPNFTEISAANKDAIKTIFRKLLGTPQVVAPSGLENDFCAVRSGWRDNLLPLRSYFEEQISAIRNVASESGFVPGPDMTGDYAGYYHINDSSLRQNIMVHTLLWKLYNVAIEGCRRARAGITGEFLPWNFELVFGRTTQEVSYGTTITVYNYFVRRTGQYGYAGVRRDTDLIQALFDTTSDVMGTAPNALHYGDSWYNTEVSTAYFRFQVALGVDANSWTEIANAMEDDGSQPLTYESFSGQLMLLNLMGLPTPLLTKNTLLVTPKYDWTATMSVFLVLSAASFVVGFVGARLFVKAKNRLDYQRAKAAANVNKKYQNFVDDPSYDNFKAYKKAVFKANLQSAIIGGSRFSKTDYWFDSCNTISNGSILNKASAAYKNLMNLDKSNDNLSHDIDDVYNLLVSPTIRDAYRELYKLILGEYPSDNN